MAETKTLVTADELSKMPDDGWQYELVRGEVIRMPPAGDEHRRIEFATGEPQNPVSRDGLVAKFGSLAAAVLSATAVDSLAKRLLRLENEDLREVGAIARGE